MCKDKSHGGQRCNSDTSEARRQRRKLETARKSHIVHVSVVAGKVQPFDKPLSMDEIRAEAKSISALLHSPCSDDPDEQDARDAELEKRVTRLGLAIGEEVDRRAGLDLVAAEQEYTTADLEELRKELQDMRELVSSSLTKIAELRAGLTDTSENSPEMMEINRLKKLTEEKRLEMKALVREVNQKNLTVHFGSENPTPTELRLSQACRDVIAEIRPVGGYLSSHALTDDDALQTIRNTVGKDYPSDWIKASEEASPMAYKIYSERANYHHNAIYETTDPNDRVEVHKFSAMEENDAKEMHAKLIEDGDFSSSAIVSRPLDNADGQFLILKYHKRLPFDATKDAMGADGKPSGEGWHYGHIVNGDGLGVSEDKQWYRKLTQQGKRLPTVNIPPSGSSYTESTAYHEFVHRAEVVVGEKDSRGFSLIERQEEAFLRRRTTREDGTREGLVYLGAPDENLFDAELGRPSNFMIAYVGKEYIVDTAREVLSVGSEAAFGNRYGSFHGLGGKGSADLDHRGFTLGIFATA